MPLPPPPPTVAVAQRQVSIQEHRQIHPQSAGLSPFEYAPTPNPAPHRSVRGIPFHPRPYN